MNIAARADDARAETLKTNEHFRLGLRSKLNEQPERAAYHFRMVLDRQPEHRAARRALGYRLTRATDGQPDHRSNPVGRWAGSHPSRWVRQPSERLRAKEALRRTRDKDATERMRGRFLVLALEPAERRRALALSLRNPHADVRSRAVRDLVEHAGRDAVAPLMHHLVKLQDGVDAGQYISQNRQTAYVEDFDVEIA